MIKIGQIYRNLAGAVLALSISISPVAQANEESSSGRESQLGVSFSRIISFGDSLSDLGNFFALTGIPPEPPYYQGRYSNGLVWIEYLAELLGMNPESIASYAIGGATTGRDNENDDEYVAVDPPVGGVDFPGLQDQLDQFENHLAGGMADPDALYVVWAGANDFLVYGATAQTISTGVGNTVLAVQRLYEAGARHILVVNLPDLGLTPFGLSQGAEGAAGLSQLSAGYNQTLNAQLDVLKEVGIKTIRVDSAGIIQRIAGNPGEFGFTDVQAPYLDAGLPGGADPFEFLFFDGLHPTTHAHSVVADEAMRVLSLTFPAGSEAEQPTDDGAEQPTDIWSSSYAKANTAYSDFAAFGLNNLAAAYFYYYRAIGDYDYYTAVGLDAEAEFAFNHGLGLVFYHAYYDVDSSSALFNYYTYLGYAYYYYFEKHGDTSSATQYFDAMIAMAMGA